MRKLVVVVLLLLNCITTQAQWINSLTVVPSNPTTSDQVKILANLSFSAGPCDDHTQFLSSLGSTYSASALHCLGMLSFICNHTDTFSLGQLAGGSYKFFFNVNEGGGPSPCSPGIVPGPFDSVSFVVTAPTGIKENHIELTQLKYDETSRILKLDFEKIPINACIQILSLDGKVIETAALTSTENLLQLKSVARGIYLLKIQNKDHYFIQKWQLGY